MQLENIILTKQKYLAIITINHPPVNAWNWPTMQDFEKALDTVENDQDMRVVIITGAGEKCFSAGFDVSDEGNSHKTSPKARELWRRIDRFPKPVIAAINGYALGGGLELAMCCQFRIMVDAPQAMVGLTELNLGIIPGWGGTQRLPLLVGKAKALDMILFSRKLNATEALAAGLVNQVSAPGHLMDDVLAFAEKLAKKPPVAVSSVLRSIAAGAYKGLDAGLKVEEEGSKIVRQSEDRKEGFSAFLEKRAPAFKGK
ncbi:MAG: enoyl-CoA hydratase/isomerase family protein [Desulfobacterales bacterium]|jgi:enoyl-CoA hydratase/carnithine racemase|nr:enoyl-CoA hydratase/isomerase family protein [Desulfobacterales bacterium]MCK5417327.1 enoyl-CoA hydratase/isomerase family protein [Desulfobacterales bacterium]